MKKIIQLMGLLFVAHSSIAQVQIGYHYRIRTTDTIYYKLTGKTAIIKQVAPSSGFLGIKRKALKANITPAKEGKLIVNFWGFKTDDYKSDTIYVNTQDSVNSFYLQVPVRTMLTVARFKSIPYTTWELGVTTIPFKIRFGYQKDTPTGPVPVPNDASTTINGGFYIGKKWGRTRFYSDDTASSTVAFTLAGFAGPTQIALSADNTYPKAAIKSNELGISTGLALQISKSDFNIGFLAGYDLTTSKAAKDWYYANRLWIGFGIGYKLAILNGGK